MAFLKLALIGDPVAHSASPGLHRAFLAEAGLAGSYEPLRVARGRGAAAIAELRAAGYRGLNITTPLKEEAHAVCTELDPLARAATSVNTIVFDGAHIRGYNTDGTGALAAMRKAADNVSMNGLRILLLGAGPTARAAMEAFLAERARVVLWNRTEATTEALADRRPVHRWEAGMEADAAFSTLPPDADLPALLLAALRTMPVVVDANYGPRATLGATLERPVEDGFEMLRAGARASFERFAADPQEGV